MKIIELLKNITNLRVFRDILMVASGTTVAQVISFLFIPLITRVYGPEEFGVLGVFMAGVAIVGTIAALTYPTAIVLPKKENEAKSLIRVSLFFTLVFFFTSFTILLFFNEYIVNIFKLDTIKQFILLFPFVILFSGITQIVQQWMIRTKQFNVIASVTMQHALIVNSMKFGIGLFIPLAVVLILISTFGILLESLLLLIKGKLHNIKILKFFRFSKEDLRLLKRYKDFPLYRAPQVFINATSQNLPVVLLSIFFGAHSAGFYTLARSVLSAPIGFIGKAVGDVLYPKLSEMFNNGLSLREPLLKSTLVMTLIGIIPFGLVVTFGPWIFGLIFGSEWHIAGEFARWMALWVFFMFINRPVVVAIPILELQRGFLIYEVLTTFLKVIALLLGVYLYDSALIAVAMFSIMGVVSYLYLIIWVILKAKR